MLEQMTAELPRIFTPYNLLLLGQAALTTLLLSAVGCLAGLILGFGLALARGTRSWPLLPLRILASLYAEVVRRVPFLVTLMLFFFGAQVVGLDLAPLTVALVATSVISTAFVGEIIRSGLASVRPAQIEAAAVMNFSAVAEAPARRAAPGLAADPASRCSAISCSSSRIRRWRRRSASWNSPTPARS